MSILPIDWMLEVLDVRRRFTGLDISRVDVTFHSPELIPAITVFQSRSVCGCCFSLHRTGRSSHSRYYVDTWITIALHTTPYFANGIEHNLRDRNVSLSFVQHCVNRHCTNRHYINSHCINRNCIHRHCINRHRLQTIIV